MSSKVDCVASLPSTGRSLTPSTLPVSWQGPSLLMSSSSLFVFCAEWSTRIWPLQLKISWKAIPRRETKSFWNNSVIVSLSNFTWKLNSVKSVVCGNLTDSPTREVSLEDWLNSNNGTGAEGNQGKRKKRQTGSTMITEEYRAGFRLTYTCGIARQFKNSTELYNERWRVLCT